MGGNSPVDLRRLEQHSQLEAMGVAEPKTKGLRDGVGRNFYPNQPVKDCRTIL
jgi:hypothetical protein